MMEVLLIAASFAVFAYYCVPPHTTYIDARYP
jgi:hypothetical protein